MSLPMAKAKKQMENISLDIEMMIMIKLDQQQSSFHKQDDIPVNSREPNTCLVLTEDKPLLRKKIIGLGYDQEQYGKKNLIKILLIKKEILKNKIKSSGIKITADLYTNKEKNTKNRFSLFLFARTSTRSRVCIQYEK